MDAGDVTNEKAERAIGASLYTHPCFITPHHGDVVERIAVHRNDFRLLPLREQADPVRHTQRFRSHGRPGEQRIHGSVAAVLHPIDELLGVAAMRP